MLVKNGLDNGYVDLSTGMTIKVETEKDLGGKTFTVVKGLGMAGIEKYKTRVAEGDRVREYELAMDKSGAIHTNALYPTVQDALQAMQRGEINNDQFQRISKDIRARLTDNYAKAVDEHMSEQQRAFMENKTAK